MVIICCMLDCILSKQFEPITMGEMYIGIRHFAHNLGVLLNDSD